MKKHAASGVPRPAALREAGPKISRALPHAVFTEAVEQSAQAISITDPEGTILYTNPAFQRLTGYSSAEILGANASILSYRTTPGEVYAAMWQELRAQRAWRGLLVNRRKDGSRFLVDLTITPMLDAGGETTHFLGMHRDVTEVHRLQCQVQNQKALIESVVDGAPLAIVLLDEDDRVVLDNQEYKKLIGDLGPEPARPILAALRARLGQDFERARSSGPGFAGQEVRHDRPGRSPRWFSCAGSWIDEEDTSADAFFARRLRRHLLLSIHEVTALKEQQETIRMSALQALLAEQEHLQGLREVLGAAVYQLEGPLNVLAAAQSILERRAEAGATDPLGAVLQDALGAGQRALETLRRSIPPASPESTQPVNLHGVIKDVLRLTTPKLLATGVTVEWRPAMVLPDLPGRPTQLSALFRQLVCNALDAIRDARSARRELTITTRALAEHVEVVVEDSGPGVPEALRLKVFEPFFTTKGARRHIGMGLTMAQGIVAGHGGLMAIGSAEHGGCRVSVQLPLR